MSGRSDRLRRPPLSGFSISVFGRFSYILSAFGGLTFFVFDRRCLAKVLYVSPPISDRLYANSRTLDIGKARGAVSRRFLVLAVFYRSSLRQVRSALFWSGFMKQKRM